ncbi:MAG: AraC family transcriptional regulator [bacterium]|nr:AraC family transcriptional regulator [bacterium]
MQTVLLLASIQAFFLVVLLLTKREQHLSDRVLATWLGIIGCHTLVYYLFAEYQIPLPWILNLNSVVPFLQGPLLYFYVDTLTAPRKRIPRIYGWHLLPAVAFIVFQVFFQTTGLESGHSHSVQVHIFDVSTYANILLLLSVPVYALVCLLLLSRYRRRVFDTFSTLDRINLNWLRYLIGAMLLVWLGTLVFFLQMKLSGTSSSLGHLLLAPVTLFVYVTGFFGFKQTTVFSNVLLKARMEIPESENAPIEQVEKSPEDPALTAKYQKSGLSEEKAQLTLARLGDIMEKKELYLEDQLTLPQVAEELGLSVNHISQVINELCDKNFHDYVNGYRVLAVQRKLEDPANDVFSLLAVGLDCGFGSKSSFNRIFKSVTGLTPSVYKREILQKRQNQLKNAK